MSTHIHHVAIPRPPASARAARAFYGDLLGLTERSPGDGEGPGRILRFGAGATEIHLIVEEIFGQDRSGRHFCLAVDDIETLRLRLEESGVAVVGEGLSQDSPHYFIRDPFGNLLEIVAITPDQSA